MTIGIEVSPLHDNEDLSFANLHLFHASCSNAALNKYRNPCTGVYSLKCSCGLELELSDDVISKIFSTATDEQVRTIIVPRAQPIAISSRNKTQ